MRGWWSFSEIKMSVFCRMRWQRIPVYITGWVTRQFSELWYVLLVFMLIYVFRRDKSEFIHLSFTGYRICRIFRTWSYSVANNVWGKLHWNKTSIKCSSCNATNNQGFNFTNNVMQILPVKIKGLAGSFATLTNWLMAFLVTMSANLLLTWSKGGISQLSRRVDACFKNCNFSSWSFSDASLINNNLRRYIHYIRVRGRIHGRIRYSLGSGDQR